MSVVFDYLKITQSVAPAVFTEVSKSSSLLPTITIPSNTAVSDFALLVMFGANPQPSDTTPSGWTKIQTVPDATGVGHRVSSFGKIMASGDIGSTVTGFDSGSEGMVLFVFRNLGWYFGPNFTAGGQQSQLTTADPNSQTITPLAPRNMAVGIKYTYGGTSSFNTNPFDSTISANNGTVGSLLVGYKYQYSTNDIVTFDSPDNGNAQTQASYYISFNDAA